ncbi:hypothetical protein [Streptomyces sp. NPDC002738]
MDTANHFQGREFDVTLVWHPLSGRQDVSAFRLETGQLCVLLSRHRFAWQPNSVVGAAHALVCRSCWTVSAMSTCNPSPVLTRSLRSGGQGYTDQGASPAVRARRSQSASVSVW